MHMRPSSYAGSFGLVYFADHDAHLHQLAVGPDSGSGFCFRRRRERWYHFHMTKLLEEAVRKVRALPLEMQEQAARMLLAYAGDEEPIVMLTPEEEADLLEAQAEMRRGEFATATEVEAVFAKYRR